MLTRLEKINAAYHSFKEDQLLTHVQLNEFLNYFEDQDRLTRICLTGLGILNGFKVSTVGNSIITISQGIGITTDGDLLSLRKGVESSSTPSSTDDLYTIIDTEFLYSHYKEYNDQLNDYTDFFNEPSDSQTQFRLLELVEQGKNAASDLPLSGLSGLSNMIVLLYLEQHESDAGACAGTSCDNYGIKQHQSLKVLLISQSDLDKVINKDRVYNKYFLYDKYLELKDIGAKRVVLNTANTASFQTLKTEFRTAIQSNQCLAALRDNLEKIYIHVNRNAEGAQVKAKINELLNFSATQIPNDVQYRYDLFKDLLASYNELKDLYLSLITIPFPDTASFPKHLMLGKVMPSTSEPFLRYRHEFYAKKTQGKDHHLLEFNLLLDRVYQSVHHYFIDVNSGIKATPSVFNSKLADRAIPFYYKTDQILHSWSFYKSKRLKEKLNLSYNSQSLTNEPYIQNPLAYNLDGYDFYRIEGYANGTVEVARTYLMQSIVQYGLDFEFQIINLNQGTESITNLLAQHPSFEHLGGVKKGGTLFLVVYENNLIADFALDYKIPKQLETVQKEDCCYLMACTYPWISSLHYINNLSRSLYGTQSRRKAMPKVYKLQVMEYSINGISLIKSAVTLDIPLESDVFLRRLHVVMETLNKRFPTGLVFEYLEEIKKFKVTKLERDTFRLVVRDLSLTSSPPIYTYSETGMLRNGKIFGLNDHVCQLVQQHRSDFYRSLHQELDPINKDDDYGNFVTDWSKWNDLKDRLKSEAFFNPESGQINRFPRAFSQLTLSHQNELTTLKNEILAVFATEGEKAGVKIYLYGDWPDGDWVDSNMLNYAAITEAKSPSDAIVQFIKLRKKLHNKNGVSKYILHLEGVGNKHTELEAVLARNSTKVEFYYQRPSVGNFIVIKA